MKTLLIFLLSSCSVFAQLNISNPFYVAGVLKPASGGAAPTYLINQNFEGTGYDNNSETWTENAAPDEDYATAPAPLIGSQSWMSAAVGGEAYSNFAANDNVYAYAVFNISTLQNAIDIFQIRNSSDLGLTKLRINADGSVRMVHHASGPTSSAGVISAGTTFHVWMDYHKGTGADSTAELFVSATSTKPGSATLSVTGEGNTTQASRIAIMGWSGGNHIVDKVRVDDVAIGSAPQ